MLSLLQKLNDLRPLLASAAQSVVDEWVQDEDGMDAELGGGGACDLVSSAMSEVISSHIEDAEIVDGGHEGDDHAWLIVFDSTEAVGVDIPPGVYETGGGYSWAKVKDAAIEPSDIVLWKIDRRDVVASSRTSADPDDMRLQPGPAFHLQPDGTWAVEDVTPVVAQDARFSGFLAIEGYWCAVFELNGEEWAQKVAGNMPEAEEKLASIARRIAGIRTGFNR